MAISSIAEIRASVPSLAMSETSWRERSIFVLEVVTVLVLPLLCPTVSVADQRLISAAWAATGVAVLSSVSVPAPPEFTARSLKVYSVSLVRPVTVKESALAPPGALLSISVQAAPSC